MTDSIHHHQSIIQKHQLTRKTFTCHNPFACSLSRCISSAFIAHRLLHDVPLTSHTVKQLASSCSHSLGDPAEAARA